MAIDRPAYMRQYINDYRAERRRLAIASLGGKCKQCGSTDRLEFDHVNPADKSNRIAKMWTAASVKFWAEVRKCQLLCFTCHKAKTYGDGSFNQWGQEAAPNV